MQSYRISTILLRFSPTFTGLLQEKNRVLQEKNRMLQEKNRMLQEKNRVLQNKNRGFKANCYKKKKSATEKNNGVLF